MSHVLFEKISLIFTLKASGVYLKKNENLATHRMYTWWATRRFLGEIRPLISNLSIWWFSVAKNTDINIKKIIRWTVDSLLREFFRKLQISPLAFKSWSELISVKSTCKHSIHRMRFIAIPVLLTSYNHDIPNFKARG